MGHMLKYHSSKRLQRECYGKFFGHVEINYSSYVLHYRCSRVKTNLIEDGFVLTDTVLPIGGLRDVLLGS